MNIGVDLDIQYYHSAGSAKTTRNTHSNYNNFKNNNSNYTQHATNSTTTPVAEVDLERPKFISSKKDENKDVNFVEIKQDTNDVSVFINSQLFYKKLKEQEELEGSAKTEKDYNVRGGGGDKDREHNSNRRNYNKPGQGKYGQHNDGNNNYRNKHKYSHNNNIQEQADEENENKHQVQEPSEQQTQFAETEGNTEYCQTEPQQSLPSIDQHDSGYRHNNYNNKRYGGQGRNRNNYRGGRGQYYEKNYSKNDYSDVWDQAIKGTTASESEYKETKQDNKESQSHTVNENPNQEEIEKDKENFGDILQSAGVHYKNNYRNGNQGGYNKGFNKQYSDNAVSNAGYTNYKETNNDYPRKTTSEYYSKGGSKKLNAPAAVFIQPVSF